MDIIQISMIVYEHILGPVKLKHKPIPKLILNDWVTGIPMIDGLRQSLEYENTIFGSLPPKAHEIT